VDAHDRDLEKISKENLLALTLEEMLAIKQYYKGQKRNPTDVELETIAQTWSEHCKHKTLTGLIEYEENSKKELIDNLLKNTVMRVTKELNKDWCLSVFKDNAGIISFDNNHGVAFKVETHNHPSALEPYGGAGTGIGGVIRDILGVGLGAKPILNTDVFCFGLPDTPFKKLPKGVLHPKRIMKGVVAGVRDYGNRMGIPTANGAVLFDKRYASNPLVYCGTVGIVPRTMCDKKVSPGDLILAVGGRTGRDGIHGATFSSLSLEENIEASVVQIGNPIMEKKIADTIIQARDKNLYTAITDCGAGGFSSAVGELGKDCGAKVHLERAPLKYAGLSPWEIWVSEAQERMVLAVPPHHLAALVAIFEAEDVESTVIGEFTNDKKLTLLYHGKTACSLDMNFLHEGVPQIRRKAVWVHKRYSDPEIKPKRDYTGDLKKILSSLNVCSKEWIIRQYDHEVQGASVLKPLQGKDNDSPGDACVIRPRPDSYKGIIVANGINHVYGDIDTYWMAASNIDEALRNAVCVGADIRHTAILDNFCWGSTKDPSQVGSLVRAARACYDIAKGYQAPFISGKDSLNNEYIDEHGNNHSIPPTLLISSISVINDIRKIVSMDAKGEDNLIYIVGMTKNELGGSHYYAIQGHVGRNVPTVDAVAGRKTMLALHKVIDQGLVRSCHDCSEGGLAVACSEMAFAGGLGMAINLKNVPSECCSDDKILFSESNSRFVVEVCRSDKADFERRLKGNVYAQIGRLTRMKKIIIHGLSSGIVIKASLDELKEAWQAPLRW
jgi:phosphoribosylformylglycinamidine synthase